MGAILDQVPEADAIGIVILRENDARNTPISEPSGHSTQLEITRLPGARKQSG